LRVPCIAQRSDKRNEQYRTGYYEQGVAQPRNGNELGSVLGVHQVVAAQGFPEMGPRHAKEPLVVLFVTFEWHLSGEKHLLVFLRMLCFPKREYVIPVVAGVDEVIGPTHAECEGMDSIGARMFSDLPYHHSMFQSIHSDWIE
jgi:hypothetical protein